ncbi:MAG: hypothetical protein KJ077_37660 [Anaerolineae bacterium]|nr:hypothetical protein [Anaerolineae bacterium]
MDLATFSPIILIDDDKRLFRTVEWLEADQLLLADKDENPWLMEAATGNLEKVSQTRFRGLAHFIRSQPSACPGRINSFG